MTSIRKAISAFSALCLAVMACSIPGETITIVVTATAAEQTLPPALSAGDANLKITGTVWHDLCAVPIDSLPDPLPIGCNSNGLGGADANGIWEADEPGIPDVTVVLYKNGDCNGQPLITTTTDANGAYFFSGLSTGKYCIIVDSLSSPNDKILTPGEWTYPASTSYFTIFTTDLVDNIDGMPVNFGWDYQYLPEYPASGGAVTPNPAIVPVVTVSVPPTSALSASDTTPPTIGEVTTVEADVYYGNAGACGSSGTITIEAYINDASGVTNAYVKYRYISSSWDGDFHTVSYTFQAGTGLTSFTIPAGEAVFELGTEDGYIQYFVYATDPAGNTSVYPAGAIAPVAIPIFYCP